MSHSTVDTEEIAGSESIYERIDRINTLLGKDNGDNLKTSLSLAEEALALSKEYGYEKGWAQSLVSMSLVYAKIPELDKSLVCISEALPLLQKIGDKHDEVRALNIAGVNYFKYARLGQALEYYNRGLSLALEIGDEDLACCISNNIGEIYYEMNKFDEAMKYYKRSYKVALKVNDKILKASTQFNMGEVSFKLGNSMGALKFFKQSLTSYREINDNVYLADTLKQIGAVYNKLGLTKKAMHYYMKSLKIFEEQGEKFYQTDVHINIGLMYMDNGQYDKAIESLKTALSIAESNSANKKVYLVHSYLSNLYEKTGDYENALCHYKLHHNLERDVSNEELERQLYVAKAQYQIEQSQKQAEIVRLKNIELARKTEEVQKKAEELEKSNKDISVISEIGQKITSTLNFVRIAKTVYKSVNTLMDATSFGIALYNDSEKTIEYHVIDRNKKIDLKPIPIDDTGSLSVWCIKNCKELCLNDVSTEHTKYIPRSERADKPDEPKSVLYCPLIIDKRVVGVVSVQSYKKNAYTQNNINTIKALASYIAIAMNNYRKSREIKKKATELAKVNTRLSVEISKRKTTQKNLEEANQKLKGLLSIDVLTGIFNRRGFEQFLGLEWRRSLREGIPLSIILIDIDFFKQYNDKHGHLAGDDCLKKVANALLSDLKRPMDFIARYGGEEFIVILPNTEADGALAMAERMRESVESLNIVHGRSAVSPYITISLGVSTIIPNRRNSRKEFINSADQALYKAKQEGRNRVCKGVR